MLTLRDLVMDVMPMVPAHDDVADAWTTKLAKAAESIATGDLRQDSTGKLLTTTTERGLWKRITDPRNSNHVHPAWLGKGGFDRFLRDMGPRKSEVVDVWLLHPRLGYIPGNTIWRKRSTILANRRDVMRLTVEGETHNASEWSILMGLGRQQAVSGRVQNGWDPLVAVMGKLGETKADAHARLGIAPAWQGKRNRGPRKGRKG